MELSPVRKEILGSWLTCFGIVVVFGGYFLAEVLGWSRWLVVLCYVAAFVVNIFRPHVEDGEAGYELVLIWSVYIVAGLVAFVLQFFLPFMSVLVAVFGVAGPLVTLLADYIIGYIDERNASLSARI